MSQRLRLAAVSFLNARPITYGIEQGLVGAERFDLRFAEPSRCAAAVAAGEADLGLMPIAGYAASAEELRVVPGIGIASRGPVRTVVLVGQVPWEEMTAIALDGASRTSQMLARLLTKERGLDPDFVEVPHDQIADAVSGTRGALIIGDLGLHIDGRFPHVYDLGEKWHSLVGLPFVYAVWAGRPGVVTTEDVALLQQSLRLGLHRRAEIGRAWALDNGVDPAVGETYLLENIRHRLTSDEISGATAFLARSHQAGLLAKPMRVRLFDAPAPLQPQPRSAPSLDHLLTDAAAGQRLSLDEAVRLYSEAPLFDLGQAADLRRQSLHPQGVVTYIIDRNINYTNFCTEYCTFCAFYRPLKGPKASEGYILDFEKIYEKIAETVEMGGTGVLMQGGIHPDLKIDWFERLFTGIKQRFPQIWLHCLSASEVLAIAEYSELSLRDTIARLRDAGLDSIPGGGAEILDDDVRFRIARLKCRTEDWVSVHRTAHQLGMRTTATMMFGVGETFDQRINHFEVVRKLQEETGGFTAFIPWSFQPHNTALGGRGWDEATSVEDLKVLAIARLYLDNIENVQASWVTQGMKVLEVGLHFGGNDVGSVMLEENVVKAAGTSNCTTEEELRRIIRDAGFKPVQRDTLYRTMFLN